MTPKNSIPSNTTRKAKAGRDNLGADVMSRIKMLIAAGAVAGTVGGWALLAQQNGAVAQTGCLAYLRLAVGSGRGLPTRDTDWQSALPGRAGSWSQFAVIRSWTLHEPAHRSADAHIRAALSPVRELADVGIRAPISTRFMVPMRGQKTKETSYEQSKQPPGFGVR